MIKELTIRMTDDTKQSVEWLLKDAEGHYQSGSGILSDLADLPKHLPTYLIFPSQHVLFVQQHIPSKKQSEIYAAANALIEDRLIDDIGDMHIMVKQHEDFHFDIAAISKHYLRNLLDSLATQDIYPDIAIPECFLLPFKPNTWSIYQKDNAITIRTNRFSGIYCDANWLDDSNHSRIHDLSTRPLNEISLYRVEGSPEIDISSLHPEAKTIETLLPADHHLFDFIIDGGLIEPGLNMLVNEFAPPQQAGRIKANWLWPMYATAAGILLFTAVLIIEHFSLNKELDNLNAEIDTTFRTTFPHIKTIVDYRLQFERELQRTLNTGISPASGIKTLHDILKQIAAQPGVKLNNLTYNKNIYTLDMLTPSMSSAQEFINNVNKLPTLNARLEHANTQEDNAHVRIQIKQG